MRLRVFVAVGVAAMSASRLAQAPADRPAFEVISIKADPTSLTPVTIRMTGHCAFKLCLRFRAPARFKMKVVKQTWAETGARQSVGTDLKES